MEARKIPGQATYKALFLHKLRSWPRIGKIRQVARVAERHPDVEAIASDLNTHGPLSFGGHIAYSLIHDLAHVLDVRGRNLDRKSTRLNSSHVEISYAVF